MTASKPMADLQALKALLASALDSAPCICRSGHNQYGAWYRVEPDCPQCGMNEAKIDYLMPLLLRAFTHKDEEILVQDRRMWRSVRSPHVHESSPGVTEEDYLMHNGFLFRRIVDADRITPEDIERLAQRKIADHKPKRKRRG